MTRAAEVSSQAVSPALIADVLVPGIFENWLLPQLSAKRRALCRDGSVCLDSFGYGQIDRSVDAHRRHDPAHEQYGETRKRKQRENGFHVHGSQRRRTPGSPTPVNWPQNSNARLCTSHKGAPVKRGPAPVRV